jgi:tripartite-type tricarboxylate transporter receptor subunit TctC
MTHKAHDAVTDMPACNAPQARVFRDDPGDTHTLRRRHAIAAAAAFTLGLSHLPARAQGFPAKPVRLVVPYPPGGATDIAARLVAVKLQELWGQTVIVENITGASGIVGAQNVQRQAPDGYTLLVTISNTHAIMPHMQAMPFDPFRDFTGVVTLVRAQSGLFVRSDVPVKTLEEFFLYARAQGKPLPVGDWGSGSFGHMLMSGLAIDGKFEVTPIHYRGAAPVVQAVLSGEISVASADVSTVLPHVTAGKIRLLAVNGTARHPAMKSTPTFSELGMADYDSYSWLGVFAPAKTPLALRETIAKAFQQVCLAPEMQARLMDRGFLTASSDPARFDAEWLETYQRFGRLVKKTGVKADT